jgi:hypothetical protein
VCARRWTEQATERDRLTTSIICWTLLPSHQNMIPTIVWIGMIQLFLLPSFGEKIESTMGDHKSLSEYGYVQRVKIPICE